MLAGDLTTMPLSDLLQWADTTRKVGRLHLQREGGTTWLRIDDGEVVEAARAPESLETLHHLLPEAADRPWLRLPEGAEVVERLFDLFLGPGGRFRFDDEAAAPGDEGGVPVRLSLRALVHDGMRHLDELPRLEAAYPDDTARLGISDREPSGRLQPIHRILLRCAASGLTLGETRLSLGLSRAALLRRVHELVALGLLSVEGARGGADPVARLIDQAQGLTRARQFDEAAHVYRTLLEADPGDRRLRHLLAEVEGVHLAHLKEELGTDRVPSLRDPGAPSAPRLAASDRQVAAVVDGRRDLDAVVVASPLRELETLKSLRKLVHLGLVSLEPQTAS